MEISIGTSSPLTRIFSAPTAADAPVKKPLINEGPSLCLRILSTVKNALATFIYFVTFCQVDLREKTALFAKQPGFYALTSLPKKESDLESQVLKAFVSLKDADGNPEFSEENQNDEEFKIATAAMAKEFSQILISALDSKQLRPVEWKVSFVEEGDDNIIVLTLYARENCDVKKLPELNTTSEYKTAIDISPKWEKTTVVLEQGDAKKQQDLIKCFARTFALNVEKMPSVVKYQEEERLKELREEHSLLLQNPQLEEGLAEKLQRLREGNVAAKDEIAELQREIIAMQRQERSAKASKAAAASQLAAEAQRSIEDIRSALNAACQGDYDKFVSPQDVQALNAFLITLRTNPELRGIEFTVAGSPVDHGSSSESAQGFPPNLQIKFAGDLTTTQKLLLNEIARECLNNLKRIEGLNYQQNYLYHSEGRVKAENFFIIKINHEDLQPIPFTGIEVDE